MFSVTTVEKDRLDHAGVLFVTALESHIRRIAALTAEMKVLITLCYLPARKMQLYSSDDLSSLQLAVSRAISSIGA